MWTARIQASKCSDPLDYDHSSIYILGCGAPRKLMPAGKLSKASGVSAVQNVVTVPDLTLPEKRKPSHVGMIASSTQRKPWIQNLQK